MAIQEKVLGTNHLDVAATYYNIGIIYDRQCNYEKALENHLKALAIWEKVLGIEHLEVANSCNDIGMIYYSQGNYSKAYEYFSKAFVIREKALGPNHPDTKDVKDNMEYMKTKIKD